MPVCKKCGRSFHACGSCYLSQEWEYEYCAPTCWESSDEVLHIKKVIKEVVDQLTPELRKQILVLFETDRYEQFILDALKNENQGEKT